MKQFNFMVTEGPNEQLSVHSYLTQNQYQGEACKGMQKRAEREI